SKRRDEDTGRIHFLKRDYSPDLGRWLTADPLDFADGPNLYAYVRNNPLSFVDPDGQFVFAIPLITWGASFVLPSFTTLAYSAATCAVMWGGYQVAQEYGIGNLFGMVGNLVLNQTQHASSDTKEETRKSSGGKRHTPDQEALKDLVNEISNQGTKPLSPSDTKIVDEWAKEIDYPGYRANPSDLEGSHWKNGPHIHFPGGGGRGQHIPVEPGVIL
ncbi:MAG: RHS repeat-associated core domain-containing protein, partial [Waddliaceae bacterium]